MKNSNIKIGTNKSFGIVFFLFFLIVSIFPLFKDGNIRIWSLIIAIIFLILGMLDSKFLTPLNKIWFKFGILLGNIISPIVMGLVFFTVVTLTAVLMRIFKKDLLSLKKNNNKTYWVERTGPKSKMKNQF